MTTHTTNDWLPNTTLQSQQSLQTLGFREKIIRYLYPRLKFDMINKCMKYLQWAF